MPDLEGAAPAQPETATPATATQAAANTSDLHAYRDARQAERTSGIPAPAPVVPETPAEPKVTAPAPVPEEPRTVSKRQHDINERIRLATEKALADDRALRAAQPAPAPTGEAFPTYADYLTTHPDASLETYIDARADHRESVRARSTAEQHARDEHIRTQATRLTTAQERIADARTTDPVLDKMITDWSAPGAVVPDILLISTREKAIADRQIPRPENDFASEIVKSEFYPQLLRHLVEHPETLDRVRACETRGDVMKLVGRLETRFEKDAVSSLVPQPKTVTSAPPPPHTVGTRNAMPANQERDAVNRGHFGSYRASRQAQRRAAQG